MAMRRTIADLVTRFRVDGLDRVRGQMDRMVQGVRNALDRLQKSKVGQGLKKGFDLATRAGQATKKAFVDTGKAIKDMTVKLGEGIKKAKEFAKAINDSKPVKFAKVGAAVVAATGIAGMWKAWSASSSSKDEILATEKLGKSIGLTIDKMSGLAAVGRQVGIELDQMGGLMTAFNDASRQATAGEWVGDQFKGISINARDSIGNLQQFAWKWSRLKNQMARDKFVGDVFGAENIAAANELMGRVNAARSSGGLHNEINASTARGGGYNQRDLALAQNFRDAINRVGEAFRRFNTLLFREFVPMFTRVTNAFAAFTDAYGPHWVKGMSNAWNQFVRVVLEAFVVFTGITKIGPLQILDGPVQNTWLLKVKDTLAGVWGWVIKTAKGLGSFAEMMEWLKASGGTIARAFVDVASAAKKIGAAINSNATAKFAEFANWLVNNSPMLQSAFWRIADVLQQIDTALKNPALKEFGDMLWKVVENGKGIEQFFLDIKKAYEDFRDGLMSGEWDEKETLFYKIGASINLAVDALRNVIEMVKTAREWFLWLLQPIDKILGLFGTDITTALFFVGLLKMSGILGLVLGAGKALLAFFAAGALGTAMGTFGAQLLAFAGAAGPIVLTMAAGALLGMKLAEMAEGTGVDEKFAQFTDELFGWKEAQENMKADMEHMLDFYGGRKPGDAANGNAAIAAAARPGPWRTQPATESKPTGPTRIVELRLNIAGEQINAQANESDVDRALRSRALRMAR